MMTKELLLEYFEQEEEYERCAQIRDAFTNSDRIMAVPVINPDGSCYHFLLTAPAAPKDRKAQG